MRYQRIGKQVFDNENGDVVTFDDVLKNLETENTFSSIDELETENEALEDKVFDLECNIEKYQATIDEITALIKPSRAQCKKEILEHIHDLNCNLNNF